jgi:pimeloyl-ACP methyl ester carboxylesterase
MKSVSFKNGKGLTLRGFVHEPKKYDTAILTLHGFPGSCTGKRVYNTARLLCKKGFLVMRFDFSGSNLSDGRFEDKLMSQEVKDIKYAIDFLKKNYKFKRLVLHGHSTGAIDAAIYAYKDKRVNRLVISGGLLNLDNAAHLDFNDRQIKDFWSKGYMVYKAKKYWTNGKKLKKAFYDEFFTLNIPKAIKRYHRPILIVHGDKDEGVPLQCAIELYKHANRPKQLYIIKGANHRLTKRKWLVKFVDKVARFANS